MAKGSRGPNWCNLPAELLQLIIKKLGVVDIMRLKAVCKSWYWAATSYISSPLYSPFPQSPWLMLPPQQHQNHTCFFNFAERRVYNLDNVLKGFHHDPRCAGSSHGWLIIYDQTGNSFLFNPFSRVTIVLPSLKFLHQHDRQLNYFGDRINYDEIRVTKAILTTNPSGNKGFTVVIIYGIYKNLAFYTHGENNTWILFGEDKFYCDILCHNDQLYVLPNNSYHRYGYGVYLEVWNFDNNFPKKVTRLEPPAEDYIRLPPADLKYHRAYLMESMGKILCVRRFTCYDDKEGIGKKISNQFYVYKLDSCGKSFEDVVTLGDEAIFLGQNQSITVSVRKFREWKRDSIYFSAWKEYQDFLDKFGAVHEVEVYNLEEKAFKPCKGTNMFQRCDTIPFWIVLNPR